MPRKKQIDEEDKVRLERKTSVKKGSSEHVLEVDSWIPHAVDIANGKMREYERKNPGVDALSREKLIGLYFLEAMDELTARAGLRVVPRPAGSYGEILHRHFELPKVKKKKGGRPKKPEPA
ncbi:MAG: hypothetical protein ACOCQ0_03940 [Desulfosalsimonas sp.]